STATSTSHFYTLSLHDALPISTPDRIDRRHRAPCRSRIVPDGLSSSRLVYPCRFGRRRTGAAEFLERLFCAARSSSPPIRHISRRAVSKDRSEEHTSELQSRSDL